jgi:hypothetical protein
MRERPNLVLRGLSVILLFTALSLMLGLVPGGNAIGFVLQITVGQVLQAGWYLFCLRFIRGEEVTPAAIFEPFARFWQVWLVAIAVPLVTALGLLLFIIPGLYVWARFGMAVFAAIDRRLDVTDAFEFSTRITEGFRLQILLLHLLLAAIGVLMVMPTVLEMENLGMLSFVIYVFVMTPLAGTAYAAAYDSLAEINGEPGEDTGEEPEGGADEQ